MCPHSSTCHTPSTAIAASLSRATSLSFFCFSASKACAVLPAFARRLGTHAFALHMSAYVSIRQHPSAYVSIRQHPSASVSIRQHLASWHPRLRAAGATEGEGGGGCHGLGGGARERGAQGWRYMHVLLGGSHLLVQKYKYRRSTDTDLQERDDGAACTCCLCKHARCHVRPQNLFSSLNNIGRLCQRLERQYLYFCTSKASKLSRRRALSASASSVSICTFAPVC
jgi:hypothetical protein